MHSQLIIVGAGGHGKVVADIAHKMNKWNDIFFLDDENKTDKVLNFEIVGKLVDANHYKNSADFVVAIGNNQTRKKIQKSLEEKNYSICSLIHPTATIANDVFIDKGSVVMAGVVINSSSHIGKGCIINTQTSVDHDNHIEDYVHLSPGVHTAGNVFIGSCSWLGIGSIVNNNISICSNTFTGGGALVVKNIEVPGKYIGVPVRRL